MLLGSLRFLRTEQLKDDISTVLELLYMLVSLADHYWLLLTGRVDLQDYACLHCNNSQGAVPHPDEQKYKMCTVLLALPPDRTAHPHCLAQCLLWVFVKPFTVDTINSA